MKNNHIDDQRKSRFFFYKERNSVSDKKAFFENKIKLYFLIFLRILKKKYKLLKMMIRLIPLQMITQMLMIKQTILGMMNLKV